MVLKGPTSLSNIHAHTLVHRGDGCNYKGTDPVGKKNILTPVLKDGAAILVGHSGNHGHPAETDYGDGPKICHVYREVSRAIAG